ncbi:PARP-domain-containing protein [Trichoderma citrinoviride]|uniref:Poly [ADP-ribose] polymerase n=1 Tax=Trichoderma citrinoviride TaxID=58853 RepID=A0A2T4BJ84_9HYPO|nr:PARP-domain-containing protein [Trichoderma citrinoviride]PTB69376.1 PARP-domain-containing protein [Trichoderma citrinoviride]
MPRRKAAAAPAVSPLDGCVVAMSGKFDASKHTHASLEQLIRSLGGSVTKSVAKTTTHVVCSEDDYNSNSAKVAAGRAKDLPVVSPEWIFEAEKLNKTVDPQPYVWGSDKAADPQANGKKRPIMVSKSDEEEEEEPEPKKAKTNGSKAAKGAKGKAKADAEPEPEPEAEEIKEEKQVAEGQFIKKKDAAIPVDEYCPMVNQQVHIDADTGLIYDASLNQTNASHNNNKFYRIQVLYDGKSKQYKTWTRWGRVGEVGQSALLGNGKVEDAIKQFEKKFKDKSGLSWENRGENPKPGKYAFVERSYNPDSDDEDDNEADDKAVKKEEDDEEEVKPAECTLEPQVKSLMELIFNQQYFQATMTALNYDANKLPLGKLSKATITRGFQQLKDLAALMDDATLAASRWNTTVAQATEMLSNMYYSIIPHAFGRNRPPVIRDNVMLKKEIELLESLSDMKDAADIMKIDRKSTDSIHPLDKQFQSLGLNEMTVLDHASSEFEHLEAYLHGSRGETHGHSYKVQDIFRIERQGENVRFDEYVEKSKIGQNRRLLWHGSRATNFGGILSQGLRIAPPEAPVSGYMFGKGIYLADMSSKSANYCCSYISGGQALLLLCEAKLGDPMQQLTNASYDAGSSAKRGGMESTWGVGMTAPPKWMDAGVVHESLKGIQMPDISEKPCATNVDGAYLMYNEFICYDVAQVKLRYLFRVQM